MTNRKRSLLDPSSFELSHSLDIRHSSLEPLTKPPGRRGQSPFLLRGLRKKGDSPRRFCEGFLKNNGFPRGCHARASTSRRLSSQTLRRSHGHVSQLGAPPTCPRERRRSSEFECLSALSWAWHP